MATYDKGDRVRVTATFKTAGTVTATTSTSTQRKPDGTDTSLTVQGGSGTGIYYVDVDLDQIGTHTVKVASTDVVIASETVELEVTKSVFDHS
tara:strand:- start:13253 stop:13531 length:279 start_codon:yes stop_codon:yes gene_type:complete